MGVEIADPRDDFIQLIDLDQSRVQLDPQVIFVCGGPVDPKVTNNHSIRNMFMNLSGAVGGTADGFVLAENFKDWEKGYGSLSDFENDIAFLSSMVVVFLESEGALTEFGLFFGNLKLRSRLVAVVHQDFHSSESFIKFGLLDPLEKSNESAVKVYTIDHRDIENVGMEEVKEILDDVLSDCEAKDSSEKFDAANRGHQVFLVFQLVNILRALTVSEIKHYLNILGITLSQKELKSALYVLQKFNFVQLKKRSSQYFYFVPSAISDRIGFNFKKMGKRRYDAAAIKLGVYDFYEKARKFDSTHRRRFNVLASMKSGEQT